MIYKIIYIKDIAKTFLLKLFKTFVHTKNNN